MIERTLSRLGTGYILNAKIIDVALGQNIRAEKVSFSTLDELSDSADILAYKLAGLALRRNEQDVATIAIGNQLQYEAYKQYLEKMEGLEKESDSLGDEELPDFSIRVENF